MASKRNLLIYSSIIVSNLNAPNQPKSREGYSLAGLNGPMLDLKHTNTFATFKCKAVK